MASNLEVMASNPIAMASNLIAGLPLCCKVPQTLSLSLSKVQVFTPHCHVFSDDRVISVAMGSLNSSSTSPRSSHPQ